MQLSTKSITSLLAATRRYARQSQELSGRQLRKIDRLLRCHDRKGVLRADILGMDPLTYRHEQRRLPLEELVKKHGFKDIISFLQAVYGKLRHELHLRGWSARKLRQFETGRA